MPQKVLPIGCYRMGTRSGFLDELDGILQFSNRRKFDIQSLGTNRLFLHVSQFIAIEKMFRMEKLQNKQINILFVYEVMIDERSQTLDRPLYLYLNYQQELMSLRHHLTLVNHLVTSTSNTNQNDDLSSMKPTSISPVNLNSGNQQSLPISRHSKDITSHTQTTGSSKSSSPSIDSKTAISTSSSPVSASSSTSDKTNLSTSNKMGNTAVNSSSSNSSNLSNPPSAVKSGSSFGLVEEGVQITVGIVAVIILIIVIIVIIYRRYKAKKDYNDTPQNFSHKPDLSFKEEYYLKHTNMEAIVSPQKVKIDTKNGLNGQSFEIEFNGQEPSVVCFHRRQNTTCYYEIEVLKIGGIVEIGYVPVELIERIKKSEGNIGSSGVGVTTAGFVQSEGENIYNYSWLLAYGDVIGIGLSRENSKFNERRAWISKNGVLLNSPPLDEMDKWIATIEISAEQKQEYNLGKQKPQKQGEEKVEQKEQTKNDKQQRERKQTQLRKQRISLRTFNKFQYYPVIMCHGNKGDRESTIISVNVGGQIFRMYDAFFRKGLLNDKSLFGTD